MRVALAGIILVTVMCALVAVIALNNGATHRTQIAADVQRYSAQQQADAQKYEAQQYAEAKKFSAIEGTKRAEIWVTILPQVALILVVGLVLVALIWRSQPAGDSMPVLPTQVRNAMLHFDADDAVLIDDQWLLTRNNRIVARQRLLT